MSTPGDPDARREEELKRERESALRARRDESAEAETAGNPRFVRGDEAPAYDPGGVHAYDPDTKATDTTKPRSASAMPSAGPTGVVPPAAGRQWKRPAWIAGAVLLIIVLLLLLT